VQLGEPLMDAGADDEPWLGSGADQPGDAGLEGVAGSGGELKLARLDGARVLRVACPPQEGVGAPFARAPEALWVHVRRLAYRMNFARAVPEVVRPRAERWAAGTRDDDDEVGALWERIHRGALIGAGFGRDLFELREDPAAVWVAAYALVAGDDPVTTQLATRAMFARFGSALLEPVSRLGALAAAPVRARLARAVDAAAGDAGTPDTLQSGLRDLAGRLRERSVEVPIEALQRAIEVADWPRALACAVEAWRISRAPALVEVAAEVAERVGAVDPLADLRGRPCDDALMSEVWARMARFTREPHPLAVRWLETLPVPVFAEPSSRRREVEEFLLAHIPASSRVAASLGLVSASPPAEPIPSPALDAIWAALARPWDARANALWSLVYANPADRTPRWVLADLYTESEDPRGPFLAASLRALGSGSRPSEEAAALRRHEKAWLGAFGDHALRPRRWEGGVVVACRIATLPRDRVYREWRTLEEVELGPRAEIAMLTPERFPSLRVIGGLRTGQLAELAGLPIVHQLQAIHVAALGVEVALPPAVRGKVVLHGKDDPYAIAQLPTAR